MVHVQKKKKNLEKNKIKHNKNMFQKNQGGTCAVFSRL